MSVHAITPTPSTSSLVMWAWSSIATLQSSLPFRNTTASKDGGRPNSFCKLTITSGKLLALRTRCFLPRFSMQDTLTVTVFSSLELIGGEGAGAGELVMVCPRGECGGLAGAGLKLFCECLTGWNEKGQGNGVLGGESEERGRGSARKDKSGDVGGMWVRVGALSHSGGDPPALISIS